MKIFNIRQGFATNSSSTHWIVEINGYVHAPGRGDFHDGEDEIFCPHCGVEDMSGTTYENLKIPKPQKVMTSETKFAQIWEHICFIAEVNCEQEGCGTNFFVTHKNTGYYVTKDLPTECENLIYDWEEIQNNKELRRKDCD